MPSEVKNMGSQVFFQKFPRRFIVELVMAFKNQIVKTPGQPEIRIVRLGKRRQ